MSLTRMFHFIHSCMYSLTHSSSACPLVSINSPGNAYWIHTLNEDSPASFSVTLKICKVLCVNDTRFDERKNK